MPLPPFGLFASLGRLGGLARRPAPADDYANPYGEAPWDASTSYGEQIPIAPLEPLAPPQQQPRSWIDDYYASFPPGWTTPPTTRPPAPEPEPLPSLTSKPTASTAQDPRQKWLGLKDTDDDKKWLSELDAILNEPLDLPSMTPSMTPSKMSGKRAVPGAARVEDDPNVPGVLPIAGGWGAEPTAPRPPPLTARGYTDPASVRVTTPPFNYTTYAATLGQRESSNDYSAVNKLGYLGKYQMGAAALEDAGLLKPGASKQGNQKEVLSNPDNWTIKGGRSAFLNKPDVQEDAMKKYTDRQLRALREKKLITDASTPEDIAGKLAASHLIGVAGLQARGMGGQDANKVTAGESYDLAAGSQRAPAAKPFAPPLPPSGFMPGQAPPPPFDRGDAIPQAQAPWQLPKSSIPTIQQPVGPRARPDVGPPNYRESVIAAGEAPEASPVDRATDVVNALAQGTIGLVDGAIALRDLSDHYGAKLLGFDTTKEPTTRDLLKKYLGLDAPAMKKWLNERYSPEMQAELGEFDRARGAGESAEALARNPAVAIGMVAESAPGMLAAGRIAKAASAAPLLGSAVGEGAIAGAQNIAQFREETGRLPNPQELTLLGASAATTSLVNRIFGGLSAKFGYADVDTMLADSVTKPALRETLDGVAQQIAKVPLAIGSEAAEEMFQTAPEVIANNLVRGRPWDENIGKETAAAGVVGGLMGGGAQAVEMGGEMVARGEAPPLPPPDLGVPPGSPGELPGTAVPPPSPPGAPPAGLPPGPAPEGPPPGPGEAPGPPPSAPPGPPSAPLPVPGDPLANLEPTPPPASRPPEPLPTEPPSSPTGVPPPVIEAPPGPVPPAAPPVVEAGPTPSPASRPAASLPNAPPALPGWLGQTTPEQREAVFTAMRAIDATAQFHHQETRNLTPPYGTVGVGMADKAAFQQAEARSEFLRALSRGATPEEAGAAAKAMAREIAEKANATRPRDIHTHLPAGAVDASIEHAVRVITQATKPPAAPVAPPVSRPAVSQPTAAKAPVEAVGDAVTDEDIAAALAAELEPPAVGPRWRQGSTYDTPENAAGDVVPATLEEQTDRRVKIAELADRLETLAPDSPQHKKLNDELMALQDEYDGTWAEIDQHMDGIDVKDLERQVEAAAKVSIDEGRAARAQKEAQKKAETEQAAKAEKQAAAKKAEQAAKAKAAPEPKAAPAPPATAKQAGEPFAVGDFIIYDGEESGTVTAVDADGRVHISVTNRNDMGRKHDVVVDPREIIHDPLSNDEHVRLNELTKKEQADPDALTEDEAYELEGLVIRMHEAMEQTGAPDPPFLPAVRDYTLGEGSMAPEDIFPTPEQTVRLPNLDNKEEWAKRKAEGYFLTPEEAAARVETWKAEAARLGKTEDNSRKVIYSLFDRTGAWSQPFKDAGYLVRTYDIRNGDDLMRFFPTADIDADKAAGLEVVGVLAAPPCRSFSISGTRWWATKHDRENQEHLEKIYGYAASKYFDTPLEYAITLVEATKVFIELAAPTRFHVLENPVGRINTSLELLPKPALILHPAHFGDPWAKKTQLWGVFDPDLPTAPVFPTEGSMISEQLRGDDPVEQLERSRTPEGFAYAFFMANRFDVGTAAAEPAAKPETAAPPSRPAFLTAREGNGQTRQFRDSLEASVWDALHSTEGAARRIAAARKLDDAAFAVFVQGEIGIGGGGHDGYSYEVTKKDGKMRVTGPTGTVMYPFSTVAKTARRLLDEIRPMQAKPASQPAVSRPTKAQPNAPVEGQLKTTWMNEGDIEAAVERFKDHPVLGPAARFLDAFKDQVNAKSDGWPYWSLPSKAAGKLQALLYGHLMAGMGEYPRLPEATAADVRATLPPIKAFMTKRGTAAGIVLPTLSLPEGGETRVQTPAQAGEGGQAAPQAQEEEVARQTFTTPGTRLTWSTGEEWAHVRNQTLQYERGISAKVYRDRKSHLDELIRHLDWIAAQPRADLEAIKGTIEAFYKPPRGQRGGTPYEVAVNAVNNALARVDKPAQAPRGVAGPYGYSVGRMRQAFNLTEPQAAAADVVRQQLQIDEDQLEVGKGGIAGAGALHQLDRRMATGLRALRATMRYAGGSTLARRHAKTFLNTPIENIETGLVATVSGESLDEMLSKKSVDRSVSPQAHMAVVANVDQLFRLATRSIQRPSRKDPAHVESIHIFDVPVPVGAEVLRARILAKAFRDPQSGSRIYFVEAVEVGPPKPGGADRGGRVARAGDAVPSSRETPPPLPANVSPTFAHMVELVKGGTTLFQRDQRRTAPGASEHAPDLVQTDEPVHGGTSPRFEARDTAVAEARVRSLAPAGGNPAYAKVPFNVAIHKTLGDTVDFSKPRIERVPLATLVATQGTVTLDVVREKLAAGPDTPMGRVPATAVGRPSPDATTVYLGPDGTAYLAGGTHRAVAAWARGDTDIEAVVYPSKAPAYASVLYQGEPFYSRLSRAVEDAKTNRASGAQWKATIRNSKSGVNKDEYVFAHVDDLEDAKAYTKSEVLAYLQANELRVVPVVLGEETPPDGDPRTNEQLHDTLEEHGYGVETDPIDDETSPLILVNAQGDPFDIDDLGTDFPQEVVDTFNVLNRRHLEPGEHTTRYSTYQEAGADEGTYREVLLTMPSRGTAAAVTAMRQAGADLQDAEVQVQHLTDIYTLAGGEMAIDDIPDYQVAVRRVTQAHHAFTQARAAVGGNTWVDGHAEYADITNPIVRVRFNVRSSQSYTREQYTDIEERIRQAIGAKSFDSIASGGPDAAVRKGAITPREAAQYAHGRNFYLNDQTGALRRVMFLEEVQPPAPDQQEKMPALLAKHWREIGFKWALRYAAENGLDAVAWTTGEMQAKRYSLEKEVDAIRWGPILEGTPAFKNGARQFVVVEPNGMGAIRFNLTADGTVRDNISGRGPNIEGRKIDEVVGKEIAKQITSTHVGTLEGEGLKIGGQGLKKLYDVDFPNVVNNLPAMKRAGVRVSPTRHDKPPRYAVKFDRNAGFHVIRQDLLGHPRLGGPFGTQDEAETFIREHEKRKVEVPGFDITPALREAVMGGQPMFQGAQGSTEFATDGKAIIRGFESANFSTAVHELFHVARRQRLNRFVPEDKRGGITDADLDVFEQWAGVEDGVWSVAAEEKAARGFERYLRDGGATFVNDAVRKVFAAIKQWMTDLYLQLEGSAIDINITPDVRAVFDKLVGADVRAATRPADQFHAPQRGLAYEDMTEAELRELLDEGVGDEPGLAAIEMRRRAEPTGPVSRPAVSQPARPIGTVIEETRERLRTTGAASHNGVSVKLLRDTPDAEYRVEVVRNGDRTLLEGHYAKEGNAINAAAAELFGADWETWWAANKPHPAPELAAMAAQREALKAETADLVEAIKAKLGRVGANTPLDPEIVGMVVKLARDYMQARDPRVPRSGGAVPRAVRRGRQGRGVLRAGVAGGAGARQGPDRSRTRWRPPRRRRTARPSRPR